MLTRAAARGGQSIWPPDGPGAEYGLLGLPGALEHRLNGLFESCCSGVSGLKSQSEREVYSKTRCQLPASASSHLKDEEDGGVSPLPEIDAGLLC
jgi:hypothetical protein